MNAASMPGRSPVAIFCLVFLPFALGHYLSCLLRAINAVLTAELLASVHLNAAQLGLLTSAFSSRLRWCNCQSAWRWTAMGRARYNWC